MTLPDGIIGYALYLESRNQDNTQQIIFTPPLADPANASVIYPKMHHRMISETHSRAKWNIKKYETPEITYNGSARALSQSTSIQDAITLMEPLINRGLSHLISGNAGTGWEFFREPIIVEMTASDFEDVRMVRPPDALIRRIRNARQHAGFPKTEWRTADEAVAPAATV